MKLDANNLEIIKRVQEITSTDYEIRQFEDEGYIDPYNLISALEDMLLEVEDLQEKIENVKNALHHEGLDYLGWR